MIISGGENIYSIEVERVLAELRAAGTLSLLDVKRGDIGSTMQAYADAYLGPDSALRADAITVSPFLGYASLRPALYGSVCFFGAIALAFATYYLVERPITRGLNRSLGLSRRWRALAAGRGEA